MLSCPSDSLFSVHISALSLWYSTVFFSRMFFHAGLWFFSRSCVLPTTADSNLNQVTCSFCIFISSFTWLAVHAVSLYLHDMESVIRMPVVLQNISDIPGPLCSCMILWLIMFHFWILLRILFVNFGVVCTVHHIAMCRWPTRCTVL